MNFSLLQQQALGLDLSSLVEWQQGEKTFLIHKDVIKPLSCLQQDAQKAGFNLQIVSAHRDFQRQLTIWNAKASGKRPLLDSQGQELVFAELTNEQKLFAILRWSAIPGLSRHHWGTDIDIFDANQMQLDDVCLVPAEVERGGPCAAMHGWLTENIASNQSYQFYRPYQFDTGGIAPEMWHLSHLPTAKTYTQQLTLDKYPDFWLANDVLLLESLCANLTAIGSNYVELDVKKQPNWVQELIFS
jgi:LAS superfamily LD-carboxypeptidase LdcB